MLPWLRSARHVVVVAFAVVVPIFGACGGRITSEPSAASDGDASIGSGAGSTSGSTTTAPPATSPATPADAGDPDRFGVMREGSGPYPCTVNTSAYYSDAGPPPPSGACHGLYPGSGSYAPGCVITIVAPAAPGTCVHVECLCGDAGRWEPHDSPPCRF